MQVIYIILCILLLLVFVIIGLALLKPALLVRFRPNKLVKFNRVRLYYILFALTVFIGSGLFLISNRIALNSSSKQDSSKDSSTKNLKPLEKPVAVPNGVENYELIAVRRSKDSMRVEIYTKEKDNADLIKLNDVLYAKYQNEVVIPDKKVKAEPKPTDKPTTGPEKPKSLYIDYFDDKDVANVYFNKILNKQLPKAEKQKLYPHYTAAMVANSLLGKQLIKKSPDAKVLKKY